MKFTDKGSIEIRLHESKGSLIRLTVADTGIGIERSLHEQLFIDFSQADTSHARKFGGTGPGLSLSRKIARLLGGDVNLVRSHFGEGSEFEILILTNPLSSVGSTVAGPRAVGSQRLPEGTKILLAEDSVDNVVLIQTSSCPKETPYLRYMKREAIDTPLSSKFEFGFTIKTPQPIFGTQKWLKVRIATASEKPLKSQSKLRKPFRKA